MKKSDKLRAALASTETAGTAPAEALPPPPPPAPFDARLIPVAKIVPSATNPRKRFDPEDAAELEGSMRAHGFTLSTLLVRALTDTFFVDAVTEGQHFVMRRTAAGVESAVEMFPSLGQAEAKLAECAGCFELVAGERRWRAAKAVGIVEAPCIVAVLGDQEVLEQQLIENLQRKDLSAMETALGFQQLLDLRVDGKPVHTKQTLHARTGKSVRHIERHVRLCALAKDDGLREFRKAFEEGTVFMRHALAVLRVPDPKLRAKLALAILKPQYDEAPLSIRKTELLVQRDYMTDLRAAGFDLADAELLPVERDEAGERTRGGPCTDCPFRLGNVALLLDDEGPLKGNADMCLNPGCLAAKQAVAWKRWQEGETDPAKKRRALSEEECRKLYRFGDQLEWNCGYVDLSERPDSTDLKPGAISPGTWKSMVKGSEIEVVVVRDRNGKRHELVSRELAVAAAEGNDHKVFKSEKKTAAGSSGGGGSMSETDEEREARIAKRDDEEELDRAVRAATAAAVAEKASAGKALPPEFWSQAVIGVTDGDCYEDVPQEVEARRGWAGGSIVSEMKKLQPHHQTGVLAELLYVLAEQGPDKGKVLLRMFGVDGKAIEKTATAAVKEMQKKRVEIRKKISEIAAQLNLSAKHLDAMALNTPAAVKFAELRDTASLEALVRAMERMVGGADEARAKGAKPAKVKTKTVKKGGKK